MIRLVRHYVTLMRSFDRGDSVRGVTFLVLQGFLAFIVVLMLVVTTPDGLGLSEGWLVVALMVPGMVLAIPGRVMQPTLPISETVRWLAQALVGATVPSAVFAASIALGLAPLVAVVAIGVAVATALVVALGVRAMARWGARIEAGLQRPRPRPQPAVDAS